MRYIGATESAKMIRKALKANFPRTRFSVRKSNGNSVRVRWTDGPCPADVDLITNRFEGSRYDAAQDLRTPRIGMHPETFEEVQFLTDFVFLDRQYSYDFLDKLATLVSAKLGVKPRIVERVFMGKPVFEIEQNPADLSREDLQTYRDAVRMAQGMAHRMSDEQLYELYELLDLEVGTRVTVHSVNGGERLIVPETGVVVESFGLTIRVKFDNSSIIGEIDLERDEITIHSATPEESADAVLSYLQQSSDLEDEPSANATLTVSRLEEVRDIMRETLRVQLLMMGDMAITAHQDLEAEYRYTEALRDVITVLNEAISRRQW